jgi:hypothetical protein
MWVLSESLGRLSYLADIYSVAHEETPPSVCNSWQNCSINKNEYESRDSSVSIVTTVQAGQPANRTAHVSLHDSVHIGHGNNHHVAVGTE